MMRFQHKFRELIAVTPGFVFAPEIQPLVCCIRQNKSEQPLRHFCF